MVNNHVFLRHDGANFFCELEATVIPVAPFWSSGIGIGVFGMVRKLIGSLGEPSFQVFIPFSPLTEIDIHSRLPHKRT